MTELARKLPDAQDVSDAIKRARARGIELVADNLPKAAEATDRAGKAVTDFIRSSAETISSQIQAHRPSSATEIAKALGSYPLVRRATRLAARHPVALIIGGAAIAAAGVAVWRLTQTRPSETDGGTGSTTDRAKTSAANNR